MLDASMGNLRRTLIHGESSGAAGLEACSKKTLCRLFFFRKTNLDSDSVIRRAETLGQDLARYQQHPVILFVAYKTGIVSRDCVTMSSLYHAVVSGPPTVLRNDRLLPHLKKKKQVRTRETASKNIAVSIEVDSANVGLLGSSARDNDVFRSKSRRSCDFTDLHKAGVILLLRALDEICNDLYSIMGKARA